MNGAMLWVSTLAAASRVPMADTHSPMRCDNQIKYNSVLHNLCCSILLPQDPPATRLGSRQTGRSKERGGRMLGWYSEEFRGWCFMPECDQSRVSQCAVCTWLVNTVELVERTNCFAD